VTLENIKCDVAIVGGGLAGGLIALALAKMRPELHVVLIEQGQSFGGNHIWSYFASLWSLMAGRVMT
jgi:lycopene beta-cyclase